MKGGVKPVTEEAGCEKKKEVTSHEPWQSIDRKYGLIKCKS